MAIPAQRVEHVFHIMGDGHVELVTRVAGTVPGAVGEVVVADETFRRGVVLVLELYRQERPCGDGRLAVPGAEPRHCGE